MDLFKVTVKHVAECRIYNAYEAGFRLTDMIKTGQNWTFLLLTTSGENDGPLGGSHECLDGSKKARVIVKNHIHLFKQDK